MWIYLAVLLAWGVYTWRLFVLPTRRQVIPSPPASQCDDTAELIARIEAELNQPNP